MFKFSLFSSSLTIGENAPEFSLKDQSGKIRRLSDYKGKKLVIYFFPKAFTPGWTLQVRSYREAYEEFQEVPASIIGVSTDGGWLQERFHSACGLPYPLIGEGGKDVVQDYGLKTAFLGSAKRRTVVIDCDGVVRAIFKGKRSMDPRPALELGTFGEIAN